MLRAKKGMSLVDWLVSALLYGAGVFTLALGTAHFFLPRWLDFRTVILERAPEWKAPRCPFRLWPAAYTATPRDLNGVRLGDESLRKLRAGGYRGARSLRAGLATGRRKACSRCGSLGSGSCAPRRNSPLAAAGVIG